MVDNLKNKNFTVGEHLFVKLTPKHSNIMDCCRTFSPVCISVRLSVANAAIAPTVEKTAIVYFLTHHLYQLLPQPHLVQEDNGKAKPAISLHSGPAFINVCFKLIFTYYIVYYDK